MKRYAEMSLTELCGAATHKPQHRRHLKRLILERLRASDSLVAWCPRCGAPRAVGKEVAYSSRATMYCAACLTWMGAHPRSVRTFANGSYQGRRQR